MEVFSPIGEKADVKMSQSEKYSADGVSKFSRVSCCSSGSTNKTGVLLWSLFTGTCKAFVCKFDLQAEENKDMLALHDDPD